MGGLRWIYIDEEKYNLLFVAADSKEFETEMLRGRLDVIGNAFIKAYKTVFKERGNTWDGDINVFLPFISIIESYYAQWEQVANVSLMAEFFDLLGVFQHLLILLRKIIEEKMYSTKND